MPRLIQVEALQPYRLRLTYDDGAEGEVDLEHLRGRGVFSSLSDQREWGRARLGEDGAVCWGESIDLCPDALYARLTGKPIEEILRPRVSEALVPIDPLP